MHTKFRVWPLTGTCRRNDSSDGVWIYVGVFQNSAVQTSIPSTTKRGETTTLYKQAGTSDLGADFLLIFHRRSDLGPKMVVEALKPYAGDADLDVR